MKVHNGEIRNYSERKNPGWEEKKNKPQTCLDFFIGTEMPSVASYDHCDSVQGTEMETESEFWPTCY